MNTVIETIETTQTSPEGFFTLAKLGERWILLTPERQPFFSVGLNHIDSSPLRYPENLPAGNRNTTTTASNGYANPYRPT